MKVCLFCYSPASVNMMQHLYCELNEVGHAVYVIFHNKESKEHFYKLFESQEVNVEEVTEQELKWLGVDFVIYNTGSGGYVETLLPLRMKDLEDTLTVHINDIFWADSTNIELRHLSLPDLTIVSGEDELSYVRENLGYDSSNSYSLVNPYFDRLLRFKPPKEREGSVSFISQCSIGPSYSEPTSEICKEAIFTLLEGKRSGLIGELLIYKHPRESNQFYIDNGIDYMKNNDFKEMMEGGVIISCGSTPHYEALMIGKNTITYSERVLEDIKEKNFDKLDMEFNFDSTKRLIQILERHAIEKSLKNAKSIINSKSMEEIG